jgi:hypothetical protein
LPAAQTLPLEQALPHLPQFLASVLVSTQELVHWVCPGPHWVAQAPEEQTWVAVHALAQAPKLTP